MTSPNADRPDPADSRLRPPIGDADAAQKTTYVTGSGTEPEKRAGARGTPARRSMGLSPLGWAAVALAALLALAYLSGVFGAG